jgi:hypothetical protein
LIDVIEIPDPPTRSLSSANVGVSFISKIKILKVIEPGEWEDFTLELASVWKKQYSHAVRCGGAGDMGRDVIVYQNRPHIEWENFQCKHYSSPLGVAEATLEIAKLVYYGLKGEYLLPKKYYFVTPQGVSSQLLNALNNPEKLRNELIRRWEKTCASKITSKQKVTLNEEIKEYIQKMDFSIFDHVPPIKLIELHKNTSYHINRFGASFPERPETEKPPNEITSNEIMYTEELLRAFSEEEKAEVTSDSLPKHTKYQEEFSSARRSFYSAENLELFSRDWLKNDSYNKLAEECYDAVSPVVNNEHKNGYKRYLATLTQAAAVNFSSHPLHLYIEIKDKKGLCHQLVNSKKIRWVKDE